MRPESLVRSIHFEDFSGRDFERLCFAYAWYHGEWTTLEWYGQLGGDSGRDIWGVRLSGETVCFLCANHQQLGFKKAREDIQKLISGSNGVPDRLILITGHRVSAEMRDRVKEHAISKGIASPEVWSGEELEERLRRDAPVLLKRFVEGESFPESPDALRAFGAAGDKIEDDEFLSLMAECFDRPAFDTPFRDESNIPDFKKAITDTIEALNTGIHRLRDGTEIRRIPSRHNLSKKRNKEALAKIVQQLGELRATFDRLVREHQVELCGCPKDDCPAFTIKPNAAREMDRLRRDILSGFARVCPIFHPRLPP